MNTVLQPIQRYFVRWNDEPNSEPLRLWPSEIKYIKERGEYEHVECYRYRRSATMALLECRVVQTNGKES